MSDPSMPLDSLRTVDRLVLEALDLPPDQRRGFVESRCGRDPAMLHEVWSLVGMESEVVDALNRPVFDFHLGAPSSGEIGPYRIVEEMGKGGLATVYRAVLADGSDPTPAALKVLRPGADPEEISRRFKREGEILGGLQHPGIARLLAVGISDGQRPYLAMELIEGQTLARYFATHRPSIRQRIELFIELCEIVAYAHRRLVVHRDLKPSNVMVTTDGKPKLLDFGISKLLDPKTAEPATQTLVHRGLTPEYASPEQVQRASLTIATDIYSLGVMLYEALAGRRPYELRAREADWWRLICEQEPEPPSRAARETHPTLARSLAGDLDAIVGRCLRKEPEHRYLSVERLADDLKRYLDGLPVTARRNSWIYRGRKLLGRHRYGITAGLVVLLLLIGFLWNREQGRRELVEERDRATAVNDLLLDIFRTVQPEEAFSSDLTLKSMVDQEVEDSRKLQGSPRLQAELIGTLGELYVHMGELDSADSLLRESQKSLLTVHGTNRHRDLIRAELRLGLKAQADGDLKEAQRRLQIALDTSRQVQDPLLLAQASTRLGSNFLQQENPERARQLLIEAAALLEPLNRPRDLARAEIQLSLAMAEQGELPQAVDRLEQALVDLEEKAGRDIPLLAEGYRHLGHLLTQSNQLDSAEKTFQQSLNIYSRVLGKAHHESVQTASDLARFYLDQGRVTESEALMGRADDETPQLEDP